MNRLRCLVVGAGFYGACLAVGLSACGHHVTLVDKGSGILQRASRVNQARVHTGFHYPRSPLTAMKSLLLHERFCRDFPDAIDDRFAMIYAIARRGSKVSAKRFWRTFSDMGAPIAPADAGIAGLFDSRRIEQAFLCREVAFDSSVLAGHLATRLVEAGVEVCLHEEVVCVERVAGGALATSSDGTRRRADIVFNVTYSGLNAFELRPALPLLDLKHEIAEIALVEPGELLAGLGITVMDGPFFSLMPFPSQGLYSFTHVRYTPQASFRDGEIVGSASDILSDRDPATRFSMMRTDAARYVPAIAGLRHVRSLFDVKTVLVRNEHDDGRPILYRRSRAFPELVSVLGGKIDNVYDLFDILRESDPDFSRLSACAVAMTSRPTRGEARTRFSRSTKTDEATTS